MAAGDLGFVVDNSYARDLGELCTAWSAATTPAPRLLVLNGRLATELGADPAALATDDGVATLVGQRVPEGATPVAQVYAGHQFGNYSPRLGDGRALLLTELIGPDGTRRDLHLKGSGRTPYARGGDGKAAVGPMLREYVISEAIHALGLPTTRSLAVVATGERIARDSMVPGAVLARIASSHVRVGTFQYAAANHGPDLVRRLADHVIARHHPSAAEDPNSYLALLRSVSAAQAELIAGWMSIGFIHGVMNTDNMTISGESIDFGPCAFMDRYDPKTVFSSIDHAGRYAYGNQPNIGQWNLARLAETLLPLIDADIDRAVAVATEVLEQYGDQFSEAWLGRMLAKLGLPTDTPDGRAFVERTLAMLHEERVDFTSFFRSLSSVLRGDEAAFGALFTVAGTASTWTSDWRAIVEAGGRTPADVADAMDSVNPIYIPRNHLVEAALTAASEHDDLTSFHRLVAVVTDPFTERPGLEEYAEPARATASPYRTFCGT